VLAVFNGGSAGTVNRFSYTYDGAGNRTRAAESSGDVTTWTYDATYQLLRERRSGANGFNVTHAYDAVGNRTLRIDSGTRTTATYDAANQLGVTYQPSGRERGNSEFFLALCLRRGKIRLLKRRPGRHLLRTGGSPDTDSISQQVVGHARASP
jgi:hypothetical protein